METQGLVRKVKKLHKFMLLRSGKSGIFYWDLLILNFMRFSYTMKKKNGLK